MWLLIVLAVGIVYGFVYTLRMLLDKKTYLGRTIGQMIVFIIINIISFLFSLWVLSWSHSVSLFVECMIVIVLVIAPVSLIFLPPRKNNDGTIDWK